MPFSRVFFLRRRPPRRSSLFPYTTLFRSVAVVGVVDQRAQAGMRMTLGTAAAPADDRSEEHTSELQSHSDLVCRLLLEKKKRQDEGAPERVAHDPGEGDPDVAVDELLVGR